MAKRLSVLGGVALALTALLAAPARAANDTCADADFLMPGQVRSDSISAVTVDNWYEVKMAGGRSYWFAAWAPADDTDSPFALDIDVYEDDCSVLGFGSVDNSGQESSPITTGHAGASESFIPDAAVCTNADGCTYRVRVRSTTQTSVLGIYVLMVETTIHIPYWQVATAAGYDAAPQIRNGDGGDTGRILFTAQNAGGSTVCTVDMGTASGVALPANGMTTFSMAGSCGISSGFGSARIAHHLAPGMVTANITTFSGMSGLSFDAPGFPRMYMGGLAN